MIINGGKMDNKLTPSYIVKELDKYIISQDEAKKTVAISLRNRLRRKMVKDKELKLEITPKNIILIGSTGIGKTEIARRIAKIADAPFIKVEATKYTEVGYVGNDVENIIKDLVNIAYKDLKEAERVKIEKQGEEEIYQELAKLYKPYDTLNDKEKEEIIKEIRAGKHNDAMVEIPMDKIDSRPTIKQVKYNELGESEIETLDDETIENLLSGALGNMVRGQLKEEKPLPIKLSMKKAYLFLMNNYIEENINYNELILDVIEKVQEEGIVFIDEIDKIVEREGSSRGEVSRQGVQRDILPIVEGCTVETRLGPVKTDHILFIAAGAFSETSPKDIMPELQGRFPVMVKLNPLKKEDFIKILTVVKNNILVQYKAMLQNDNLDIIFSKSGIERIAELTEELNEKVEDIGARRIGAIIEAILREEMFLAPYDEKKKITVDKKYVDKMFKTEIEDENLDKYIL